MRVGIYSAVTDFQKTLTEIVKLYFDYSCIECEIDGVKDSAELSGCLNRNQYDIFFMDLDMKEDCWEAIETIRYIDCNCALILAAEGAEYAVKGYRTGAVDYLLKPLLKENVMDSLGNALKRMNLPERDNQAVKVRISGIWSTVALDSIAYIESAGHVLLFYMTDSTSLRINASFKDYAPVLNRSRSFCRCHKSFQVNLNHVADLKGSCFIMTDGRTVNISRKFKQSSKADYITHIMEKYITPSML